MTVYCLNWMKVGQLILRKMMEIVATRCQILKLKCTKINFDWGSATDPTGELTVLPRHSRCIKGALLLREEEAVWERERRG